MRKSLLSLCMMLASACVFGQEQKRSTASFYVLDQQPAVMISLPYAPAVVLQALHEYEMNSYRSKKHLPKDYQAFENTPLMRNNRKEAPLTMRVGPKDWKNNNESVVYLMLNSTITSGDHAGYTAHFNMNDAIAYLDNLSTAVHIITLDKQIKQQTAMLKRIENKQAKCEKLCSKLDGRNETIQKSTAHSNRYLAYKKSRLTERLTKSRSELALQKSMAQKHRQDLAVLTTQRKANAFK